MTRQEANLKIVEKLKEFFEKEDCKDLRFWQGIQGLGLLKAVPQEKLKSELAINDNFYEESTVTLNKLK